MPPPAKPSPLLLIEDTASLRLVYRSVLETAGHSVVCAGSIAEGRKAFAASSPQIVLLDLLLPDGEGLGLMREMLAAQPETAIIVITANASINKAVEAMRGGAHDFLVKPFDEVRLLNAVRNAGLGKLPPPKPSQTKERSLSARAPVDMPV